MFGRRTFLGIVGVVATLLASAALLAVTVADGHATTAAGPAAVGGVSTAGCGKAAGLATGTHTIQSGGTNRTYILNVPAGYSNTHPYRLIFGFHWYGGTATDVATGQTEVRDVWAYYGLLRLSNSSAIFVAPQGLNNGWANTNGSDVTFTDDMVKQIESALCVDTTQVFSIGFSYGGAMSYNLACARPDVFRAVAVQSGGPITACNSTKPVAYYGQSGISDTGAAGGRSARDTFVKNNGCTPATPPEPTVGSKTHTTFKYSGCTAGYPVEWAAFDGAHIAAPYDGGTSENGSATWTPAAVWKFFTQFDTAATAAK